MHPSSKEGPITHECTTCHRCGCQLTMAAGTDPRHPPDGACICDACYHEMLVPGPGDAHGNMS
jgi:hypothetical protein